MKDNDLDILLAEYRNQNPSDSQMLKWRRAVRQELREPEAFKNRAWMQLAAASVIGFILGALVFKTFENEDRLQRLAEYDSDNATIEYVFTKTN